MKIQETIKQSSVVVGVPRIMAMTVNLAGSLHPLNSLLPVSQHYVKGSDSYHYMQDDFGIFKNIFSPL